MVDYDTSKKMFWKVGDNIFYNRIDATTESIRTNQELKFHLFEDAFDSFDWEVEPKETWESILRQRAQQLRDTYSYLRLWYSGGVDSHTTLMTFIKNNIHLDEIAIIRTSPYENFEALSEVEITKVALPFIRLMKNELEKTKITEVYIGNKEYTKFIKTAYETKGYFGFRPTSCKEIHLLKPNELYIKGNVCEVRGYEKPKLFIEDGRFYTAMWDTTNGLFMVGDHNVEGFFISGEMPKVHIKQVHMFKNHLKDHYNVKTEEDLRRLDKKYYDFKQHVNEICRYPLPSQISLGKGGPALASRRREFIVNDMKMHSYEIYDNYLDNIRNQQNSILRNHCTDNKITSGFIGVLSKKYYIGT